MRRRAVIPITLIYSKAPLFIIEGLRTSCFALFVYHIDICLFKNALRVQQQLAKAKAEVEALRSQPRQSHAKDGTSQVTLLNPQAKLIQSQGFEVHSFSLNSLVSVDFIGKGGIYSCSKSYKRGSVNKTHRYRV